ncbi:hypothetical protein, partial [Pasteurella multocida]|uniref:hypothetical protein n=1 Tax=Pasteurella multocida TaxID=747 RepID=UPI001B7D693B
VEKKASKITRRAELKKMTNDCKRKPQKKRGKRRTGKRSQRKRLMKGYLEKNSTERMPLRKLSRKKPYEEDSLD